MSLNDTITALGTSIINLVNNKVAKYVPPTATDINLGVVKPDNETIVIDENGVISSNGGASRNIGEIVASTIPLTDAGLHLLDGALLDGSGIYAEFVDYIADLYADNPSANYWTTETDWQASVTTYGSCGKFVYDSTLNTVRLPKVSDILQGTTDVNALGDLIEAGLPNITGNFGGIDHVDNGSGTYPANGVFNKTARGAMSGGTYMTSTYADITFDASLSNSIYGNSTTVQPQTIQALLYIVIATSTKTDIQVDIDEIATDLNSKVDKADLEEVQCVVETYENGVSWYRVYSDGWCEQGGSFGTGSDADATLTLLKPYRDVNYHIGYVGMGTNTNAGGATYQNLQIYPTSQSTAFYRIINYSRKWRACGYIEV